MNEQLLKKVLSCPKLPSLPAVAVRVVEMTADADVTMRDLAQVIENDQGLATRILKTVNSAFYGLPKQCSTLTHAQSLLGLDAVKTLALGFSLVSSMRAGAEDELDYQSHWRRAIFSAIGAKSIVSMVRRGDAEEAFLGGLLQDVGVIAMARAIGPEYTALVRECGEDHRALVKKELIEFELQHPDVGAMLAERWSLPGALVMPVKYHERPTAAPLQCRDVVRAVALGNLVTDVQVQEDQSFFLSEFYQRANQWFSLTPTQADEILETVTSHAQEVARMFEVDLGALPRTDEILELASDRLATIAMQENRHAMEVVAENEEFRRTLDTDALTGLGTRSRFLRHVAELYERADAKARPLSVALFDADNFRYVNEEHGEETGDIVLAHLGQRLASLLAPHQAEVFRYGGEEFAAALVETDRRSATELVDAVREELGGCALDLGPTLAEEVGDVRVTLSVGVATLDRETAGVLVRSERLIHAADKAVYAAKEAGGDCVRAFTPKRRRAA